VGFVHRERERAVTLNSVPALLSFCRLPIPVSTVLTRALLFIWTQDLPTDPVASETRTAASEPGQTSGTSDEPENLADIKRSSGSEGSAEGQHKASLKEKIAGGMKVVSGKLGHDKSKVEEGRKLMHGQSA